MFLGIQLFNAIDRGLLDSVCLISNTGERNVNVGAIMLKEWLEPDFGGASQRIPK
jgi:hypothetical protein